MHDGSISDEIFDTIAAFATGLEGARVAAPDPADDGLPARFAVALNRLLDHVAARDAERRAADGAGELRFRGLLEATPDAMLIADREGRIVLANGHAEAMFGYARGELVGSSIEALVPERFREGHARHRSAYAGAPRVRPMGALELSARRKDGTEFPVDIKLCPIQSGGGTLTCAAVRDVTERQRADEQRALLAAIVASSDDAIIGETLDGLITSWNAGAERMFGYTAAEAVGQPVSSLVPRGAPYDEPDILRRVARGERVDHFDTVCRRQDGELIDVSVTISAVRDRRGNLVGASKIARDVSERKRAELALARAKEAAETASRELAEANGALQRAKEAAEIANRAKSSFLANMSHEIRTPMNAVLGYTQLLQRSRVLDAEHRGYVDVILKSGDHLLELINDVLEMSKIEAGVRRLNCATVDLQPLFGDLERMFRLRCDEKRLAFEFNRSAEVPRYVVADEGKLRQVLVNLLGNAVKFTSQGGIVVRLHVDRASRTDRVVIDIEDTGPGIETEDLALLFQPFSQTRVGIEAKGGTGLGLALSREFARLMGGDVTVRSTRGRGSVFRLDLPLELGNPPSPGRVALPSGRALGIEGGIEPPRVLVVDDHEDNRGWLTTLLRSLGFEVREATNGEEAVRTFEVWTPRVILMDVHMPGMDGLAATRAIRDKPSGALVAIIAITASAFDDTREAVIAAGADGWVKKPCREGALLHEIARVTGLAFRYDGSEPSAPPGPGSAPAVALSPDVADEIREAARVADYARLGELIEELPREAGELASDLRDLLARYAYDEIARRVRPAGEP